MDFTISIIILHCGYIMVTLLLVYKTNYLVVKNYLHILKP